MIEEQTTIPRNAAETPPQEAPENLWRPRNRGRPAGSKDCVPRRSIKVERFLEPVEMTPPRATSAPSKAPPKAPPKEVSVPPRDRTPSPLTPRTLYRQTSESHRLQDADEPTEKEICG